MKACVRPLQPVTTDRGSTPKIELELLGLANGAGIIEVKDEDGKPTAPPSRATSPAYMNGNSASEIDDSVIAEESSHFPLDAAIAASISTATNESKAKTAASAILVIGGSSALKGLNAFLEER